MKREELKFGISVLCTANCSLKSVLRGAERVQVPWKRAPERVTAPCGTLQADRGTLDESSCLGMQLKAGGKSHPRLNTGKRPIANKYREGKMKST